MQSSSLQSSGSNSIPQMWLQLNLQANGFSVVWLVSALYGGGVWSLAPRGPRVLQPRKAANLMMSTAAAAAAALVHKPLSAAAAAAI